jgi:hypothetical protein
MRFSVNAAFTQGRAQVFRRVRAGMFLKNRRVLRVNIYYFYFGFLCSDE